MTDESAYRDFSQNFQTLVRLLTVSRINLRRQLKDAFSQTDSNNTASSHDAGERLVIVPFRSQSANPLKRGNPLMLRLFCQW